jgi:hypothetical protein
MDKDKGLLPPLARTGPILMDLSNLEGMGALLYDDFIEFANSPPDKIWLINRNRTWTQMS